MNLSLPTVTVKKSKIKHNLQGYTSVKSNKQEVEEYYMPKDRKESFLYQKVKLEKLRVIICWNILKEKNSKIYENMKVELLRHCADANPVGELNYEKYMSVGSFYFREEISMYLYWDH